MADDKYITFKREDFFALMGELALPPWADVDGTLIGGDIDCAPLAEQIRSKADGVALADAVVIRRQDYFASPALAGYAAAIGIATRLIDDDPTRKSLLKIADYFERQAQLAAEEGWKLPDV